MLAGGPLLLLGLAVLMRFTQPTSQRAKLAGLVR
jgi:hypothetical protein